MKWRSIVIPSLLCLAVRKEAQADGFKHELSVGLEAMRYFYKEPDVYQDNVPPHVWVRNSGYLGGIHASYRLTWNDQFFLSPEGRILYGKHNYKAGYSGHTISTTKKQIPALLYEPRLLAGFKIPLWNTFIVSPYTGLGYHFKSDDSEKVISSQEHMLGYYRKSNYVYVPVGASIEYAVDNIWSVAAKGEYDALIKGWQYTRYKIYTPVTNKQRRGYGLKGEVSVSCLYDKVKLSVSPYIHYWSIKNSNRAPSYDHAHAIDITLREPFNHTVESGLRVGVSF